MSCPRHCALRAAARVAARGAGRARARACRRGGTGAGRRCGRSARMEPAAVSKARLCVAYKRTVTLWHCPKHVTLAWQARE